MHSAQDQVHPTRFEDIAVTIDFHCNSACTFCIVQEGMNRFLGVPFERFKALADDNRLRPRYDRVIFTGGEVTLEKSLFEFVEYARDFGGFQHIRVQTNGRRLADEHYARALVDAGVDELFVSLHGDTPELHDAITRRKGSFDELVRGLDNLRSLDARVITNTVLHRKNVGALTGIVELAHSRGVGRMELWNYLPMEDYRDEGDHVASVSELMPPLRAALDRCRELSIEAVTKYVPRCLLGSHGATLDNGQPDVIIVERFWDTFPRFDCLYEAECEHSEECLGLHHTYVEKFGWEEDVLAPTARTRPWAGRPKRGRPEQYGDSQEARVVGHPAWEALLADLDPAAGRILGLQLTRNEARYTLSLPGGEATLDLVLSARDESSPALARTRSFNVFYTRVRGDGERAMLERLLRSACTSIEARDDGTLSLDHRKGLVAIRTPKHPRRR